MPGGGGVFMPRTDEIKDPQIRRLKALMRRQRRRPKAYSRLRKQLVRRLFAFAKAHPRFRQGLRRAQYALRRIRYGFRALPVRPDGKLVFFECYKGQSYACSPRAIYEEMLRDPAFSDYRFIWSFNKPRRFFYLQRRSPRTLVIRQYGRVYETALAMSGTWITNYRMLDHLIPRPGQNYVQCWHGTPLKRLGCDLEIQGNAMNTIGEIHRMYRQDSRRFRWLLSPSPFATEKFITAWDLAAQGKTDCVIEEGYPRNDRLFSLAPEALEQTRRKLGLSPEDDRKIVLYAPTWRDNQHRSGVGYVYDLPLNPQAFADALGDRVVLLCRFHYLVAGAFNFRRYRHCIKDVSRFNDINLLYGVSDLLVTDYSSVCFDYANLGKPMLFYMYDMDEYREDIRGFYMPPETLPGDIVRTEEDLIEKIRSFDFGQTPDEKYRRFHETYNPLDDGCAARRVVARIFEREDRDKGQTSFD